MFCDNMNLRMPLDCGTLINAKSIFLRAAAAAVILAGTAELATRTSGLSDFPIYDVDNRLGYIPKPDQAGRFLNKNSWFFNGKSMPTGKAWAPELCPNILQIGIES
jgi:hypothetical protein